jgi:hypothetical protein
LKQYEGKGESEDYMTQMRALLDKQRGDPEELARQDMNMALMQLGLGMAGSKNQSVLGAIAEGGIPALTAYGQSRSERKKDERALTTSEMEALGVNAKMSQEERANAQARAIAIDNARRADEEAAFERGPKFEAAQRAAARAGSNNELELLQAAMNDPALAEMMFRRSSYGSIGRGYASEINKLRGIINDFKLPKQQRDAAQIELNTILKRQDEYLAGAGMGGGDGATATGAPNYNLGGKTLIPVN